MAYTPDSVTPGDRSPGAGHHPSGHRVATALKRPTRMLRRAALLEHGLLRILFGLAPDGVYRAAPVARRAGGLLHRRFTLTRGRGPGRSVLCGTGLRVSPSGCYPPSCPAESGRSSVPAVIRRPRGVTACSAGPGGNRDDPANPSLSLHGNARGRICPSPGVSRCSGAGTPHGPMPLRRAAEPRRR